MPLFRFDTLILAHGKISGTTRKGGLAGGCEESGNGDQGWISQREGK